MPDGWSNESAKTAVRWDLGDVFMAQGKCYIYLEAGGARHEDQPCSRRGEDRRAKSLLESRQSPEAASGTILVQGQRGSGRLVMPPKQVFRGVAWNTTSVSLRGKFVGADPAL